MGKSLVKIKALEKRLAAAGDALPFLEKADKALLDAIMHVKQSLDPNHGNTVTHTEVHYMQRIKSSVQELQKLITPE